MNTNLPEIIETLGHFSDDVLDTKLSKACHDFDPKIQDPVVFIRNLLDLIVRYAGGSDFLVQILSVALTDAPEESPQEMESRRAKLEEAESKPWDQAILNIKS